MEENENKKKNRILTFVLGVLAGLFLASTVTTSVLLGVKNADFNELTSLKEELNISITNLTIQINSLNEQKESLNEQIHTITVEKQNLQAQKQNLEEQVEALEGDATQLEQQIDDLEDRIDKLDKKVESLEQQKSYLDNQIISLTEQLEEAVKQNNMFTVFYSNGSSNIKVVVVEKGKNVNDSDIPEVPSKTGYTGSWSNDGKNVQGHMVIYPQYEAIDYSVSLTNTNVSVEGTYSNEVSQDSPVVITFAANPGYELPVSVSVDGCSFIWDRETGTLTLNNPSKDVTVSVTGTLVRTYNIEWHKSNVYKGLSLYQTVCGARKSVVGATSKYINQVAGVTPINVGETENDDVNLYVVENEEQGYYDVYVLADSEIVFDKNDFLNPILFAPHPNKTVAHYSDIATLTPTEINSGDFVLVEEDETSENLPTCYTYYSSSNVEFCYSVLPNKASVSNYDDDFFADHYICAIEQDESYGNETVYYCYNSLTEELCFYDLSYGPFMCCQSESITVENVDTSNLVNFCGFFGACSEAKYIDFKGLDFDNAMLFKSMFASDASLTGADFWDIDTSKAISLETMFYECASLKALNVEDFDVSNVTTFYQMFSCCSNLTSLDVSKWDTSSAVSMQEMFSGIGNVENFDLSNFDTSKVENMTSMFDGCELETIDLTNCDFSSVKYMDSMFRATDATSILLPDDMDTSNLLSLEFAFENAAITSIDLSMIDTENVVSMYNTFAKSNITTIDISMWSSEDLIDCTEMFNWAESENIIFGEEFTTKKVTSMNAMFSHCYNVDVLDLSYFHDDSLENCSYMFYMDQDGKSDLSTIIASEHFNPLANVNIQNRYQMFKGCNLVVGGEGTTGADIGDGYVNGSGACIDGKVSTEGESKGLFTPAVKLTVSYTSSQGTRDVDYFTINNGEQYKFNINDGIHEFFDKYEDLVVKVGDVITVHTDDLDCITVYKYTYDEEHLTYITTPYDPSIKDYQFTIEQGYMYLITLGAAWN